MTTNGVVNTPSMNIKNNTVSKLGSNMLLPLTWNAVKNLFD